MGRSLGVPEVWGVDVLIATAMLWWFAGLCAAPRGLADSPDGAFLQPMAGRVG
jgi:hypothetical protein